MVRRSGQTGVPVIAVDGEVVVGFDEPRLARLVSAAARPKRLGASVAPTAGGLRVGQVHAGSIAARAGLRPGDTIVAVNGAPVSSPEQFQAQLSGPLQRGAPISLSIRRDDRTAELRLTPPFE